MATKEKRLDRNFDPETGVLTINDLRDENSKPLNIDVAKVTGMTAEQYAALPEMAKHLFGHGANAKFGDAGASKDKGLADIQAVVDAVAAGNWTQRGTGTGGGGGAEGLLVEALMKKYGQTKEAVQARLSTPPENMDVKEWHKELRSHPAIKPVIEEIKAARQRAKAKAAAEAAKGAEVTELALF